MTASTNQDQALEILRAVTLCRERLGVHCALGVSNISFGLPAREKVQSLFSFGQLPIPRSQLLRVEKLLKAKTVCFSR